MVVKLVQFSNDNVYVIQVSYKDYVAWAPSKELLVCSDFIFYFHIKIHSNNI